MAPWSRAWTTGGGPPPGLAELASGESAGVRGDAVAVATLDCLSASRACPPGYASSGRGDATNGAVGLAGGARRPSFQGVVRHAVQAGESRGVRSRS